MTLSAIQLQASKLLQTGLAFVASIILARGLGPSGIGGYASLLAVAVLLQGLTSFGFEDLVLARGPLYGSDTPKALSLYRQVLWIRGCAISALVLLSAACFAGIVRDPFDATSAFQLGCGVLYAAINSVATLGAVVQAARVSPAPSAGLDAVWSTGVTVTYALLTLLHGLTLSNALLVMVLWQAAIDVGYGHLLGPLLRRVEGAPNVFRLRESATFWLNGLLSIGVGKNSDVLAMQVAGAPASTVGRYSAAYNANLTAAQLLVQGTGTMLYVGLGRIYGTGSQGLLTVAWRTTSVIGGLLSVPLLLYCMAFPHTVLVVMYGPPFGSGASALVVLAATSAVVRVLGGGNSQSILFLAHHQAWVLTVRTVAVVSNVVLDIVLYRAIGILGVALASGCCGAAAIMVEYVLTRRIVNVSIPWAAMARVIAPYTAACVGARLVTGDTGSIAALVLSLGIVFIPGSLLLLITRPLVAGDIPSSAPRAAVCVLSLFARPPAPG